MKLHELIAKVHEDMEGRYDLTGEDLYYIHAALCEGQFNKPPVYGQWIDVNVRQPEYMDVVLITVRGLGHVIQAQYGGDTDHFSIGDTWWNASHWMPLPPSPGSVDVEEKKDDTDRYIPTTKVDDGITAAALRNRLREANKEIERLKQENERLKEEYDSLNDVLVIRSGQVTKLRQEHKKLEISIDSVKDMCSSEMSNYIAVKDVLQALNPKD